MYSGILCILYLLYSFVLKKVVVINYTKKAKLALLIKQGKENKGTKRSQCGTPRQREFNFFKLKANLAPVKITKLQI